MSGAEKVSRTRGARGFEKHTLECEREPLRMLLRVSGRAIRVCLCFVLSLRRGRVARAVFWLLLPVRPVTLVCVLEGSNYV